MHFCVYGLMVLLPRGVLQPLPTNIRLGQTYLVRVRLPELALGDRKWRENTLAYCGQADMVTVKNVLYYRPVSIKK